MICTDTDNYVSVLSTIKKERKKERKKEKNKKTKLFAQNNS